MGLFSTKKTITVTSAVYNLAGDIDDRPDFLKTVAQGHVIAPTGKSFSDDISASYLYGPGMKLRSFARWARTSGYSASLGLPMGQLHLAIDVDISTLVSQIPTDPGGTIQVLTAEIGSADYSFWVDRWMLDNYPAEADTLFEADFDEDANLITVTRAGGSVHTFTPVGFYLGTQYLYASYFQFMGGTSGPIITGSVVSLGTGGAFPSTSGWTNLSTVNTPQSVSLVTSSVAVSNYSDGRPEESVPSSSSLTTAYNDIEAIWERSTYTGMGGGGGLGGVTTEHKETRYQWTVGAVSTAVTTNTVVTSIGGGVTRTTVTTTSTDTLIFNKSYRVDTQDNTIKEWGPGKVLIYQQDSGNSTLDGLFTTSTSQGEFFPFIPLYLNSVWVEPGTVWAGTAESNVKALRRAMGTSYTKLLDKIKDNPSIGDIDYAYVTFGSSLNTKEMAARRYIYEFFQEIMTGQDLSGAGYDAWRTNYNILRPQVQTWLDWRDAQLDPGDPLFGTAEPTLPTFVAPPSGSVKHSSTSGINYDMTISWTSIREEVNPGSAWPGAQAGELHIEMVTAPDDTYESWFMGDTLDLLVTEQDSQVCRITWQEDSDTWRQLDIRGLNHTNMIYGGKGVYISASEALADGSESGFIIPLHETVFERMPLMHATQMSTACCYLVFNCYTIVKTPWYASSWFKILLVVAVIIITVVTGGAGAGSVGLLGANGAVGAALGFTGVTATIVGAIANAVAAMLVMSIITKVSTAVFGDKVGAIVGAIASLIALQVGTSLLNGGIESLATGFSDLMRADNLLKLTVAAGKGYSEFLRIDTQEMIANGQVEIAALQQKSTELDAKFEQEFGASHDILTQQALTASTATGIGESPASFLGRTLMTGSDIADLSLGLISRFSDLTLTTDLPT